MECWLVFSISSLVTLDVHYFLVILYLFKLTSILTFIENSFIGFKLVYNHWKESPLLGGYYEDLATF